MIVLDTDHLSFLEWGSAESSTLKERLVSSEDQAIVASIISYEEQTRGWMAHVARLKKVEAQVASYSKLRKHLQLYCSIPLLNFTDDAAGIFNDLRSQGIRIGTMDLKIAAICLANEALLLTRNSIDFEKVPALRFEDWTIGS
jgi:tRNA(fMet)-specific endonuclease VapC